MVDSKLEKVTFPLSILLPSRSELWHLMNQRQFVNFSSLLNLNNQKLLTLGLKVDDLLDPDRVTCSSLINLPYMNMYHIKSAGLLIGYMFVCLPMELIHTTTYFVLHKNSIDSVKQVKADVKYQSSNVTVLHSDGSTLVTLNNHFVNFPREMLHGVERVKKG